MLDALASNRSSRSIGGAGGADQVRRRSAVYSRAECLFLLSRLIQGDRCPFDPYSTSVSSFATWIRAFGFTAKASVS